MPTNANAEARAFIRDNVKDGLAKAKDAVEAGMAETPRATDVEAISLDGVEDVGLIRGDVALTAINLLSAKLITQVVSRQYKGLLEQFVLTVLSAVGGQAVVALLAKRLPTVAIVLSAMRGTFGLPARLAVQALMEKRIRQESHKIRRQCQVVRMKHGDRRRDGGPRRRKTVRSRHHGR